ncbi:MAG: hypothetical protein QOD26_1119 [Betaproteobacteria bacterium]|nr:hypothetical protein [Betaproteobacteria bacterium]
MRKRIAVTLAAALLLPLGAYAGEKAKDKDVKAPNASSEATTNTGTGNTAGQSAAAGASSNSQSARETARENATSDVKADKPVKAKKRPAELDRR